MTSFYGGGPERSDDIVEPWVREVRQRIRDRRTASILAETGLSHGQICVRAALSLGDDLDPVRFKRILVDVIMSKGKRAQRGR